ncbi:MAG: hypothetical protein FD180_1426 [Planctomycetota bacterium]|nr:MAG: hypothetical protein FD180_1426 [Planctomycetota bacterium]
MAGKRADPERTALPRRADIRGARLAAAGRRLLRSVVRECGGMEATLWALSATGKRLEAALNVGATPEVVERSSVPVADSVVGMVAATGIAAVIGPGHGHNTSVDRKTGTATRAMAAAPVTVAGELAGVVSVINPKRGREFRASVLETLSWKAQLLGRLIADRERRK